MCGIRFAIHTLSLYTFILLKQTFKEMKITKIIFWDDRDLYYLITLFPPIFRFSLHFKTIMIVISAGEV